MKSLEALTAGYPWKFRRIGGIFQVEFTTIEDLRALNELDPKLWVALSCPVDGLEIDQKTLELIDHDEDGRVRVEEVLAAVNWTLARLSVAETLFDGSDLPLAAINTEDAEGAALMASAQQILSNSDKDNPTTISVATSADTAKIYGQSKLNGDGVIGLDATDDPEAKALITDIINTVGGAVDRNGSIGITRSKLETFFAELTQFENWWTQGEAVSNDGAEIFPLGDKTPAAFESYTNVERKINDFFARCQLAAFDARSQEPLNRDISLYKTIAHEDFAEHQKQVEQLPISKITPECLLSLTRGINPEWQERVHAFLEQVIKPMEMDNQPMLDLSTWNGIKKRFSGFKEWRKAKPATLVEKLAIARIRSILKADTKKKLERLLEEDQILAPRMKSVDAVEKLARMHRDLIRLLRNFVNFRDFYDDTRSAIFQAGTLFLDGRECRLCLKVEDPAKHAALASLSRAFVVYCECRRKDSKTKFYIAAIFTDGDSANLIIGRNGIFRDKANKLWDTTVVRLIENPISLREAFWMPYIRLGRFIGEQLEKWAVSRDKAIQKQLETGVETTTGSSKQSTDGQKQSNIGGIAGMIAAGGIALGALGAGLSSLFKTMQGLTWWELPIIIGLTLLMISLPSMVLAWLKIRKRTLAPLLDASGWAVNGRTLISFKLGRQLTKKATLPITAKCLFDERYKTRRLLWLILGLIIVATASGLTLIFI